MVFIHRQKDMRVLLHYLPVHLQTWGVLHPYTLARAQQQQCASFSTALGWMTSVTLRKNKLPFIAERTTKPICLFLMEGDETEKLKANVGTLVWSWMSTLSYLSLHAEVTLMVCDRGWNRI